MAAHDGSRLDGEDTLSPAPGARIKGHDTDYALRFHLHPAVKASRLSDARGVMLVLPNRDVWTFEALDDKVELEDSVFLAGNDGPRRTAQIVIRQDSQQASSVRWTFVRSTASPSATTARRNARREPEFRYKICDHRPRMRPVPVPWPAKPCYPAGLLNRTDR